MCVCVIAIASMVGHPSASRRRERTPGPQSTRSRSAVVLEQVPRMRSSGVWPSGRAADDRELHVPILTNRGREDQGGRREAGARRPRPRREDHRAGAPRRRHGGHLHGPPSDARADRRDGDPGGRRRRRDLDPLRRAHDARPSHRRPAPRRGADDVLVVVGGTVPTDDAVALKALGVAEVFGPGAPTGAIVEFLQSALAPA